MSFVGTENFIKKCEELLPFKFNKMRKIKSAINCFELRITGRQAIKFYKFLYEDTQDELGLISAKQLKFAKINFKLLRNDKYEPLLKKFFEYRLNGVKPMEISKILNLLFQTIYDWIKKHEKTSN